MNAPLKLYFSPGACSLASHIALHEAGLEFTTEKVDLAAKKTEAGADFNAINPKGYVPALAIGDDVLTEGTAVMQFIADKAPNKNLAPAAGSVERYRLQEWLGFINSEVHKPLGALFAKPSDDVRNATVERILKRLAYIDGKLAGQDFLLGNTFTVVDGYLFTVLGWTKFVGVDISAYPNVGAFLGRVAGRPAVQAALKAEGLLS